MKRCLTILLSISFAALASDRAEKPRDAALGATLLALMADQVAAIADAGVPEAERSTLNDAIVKLREQLDVLQAANGVIPVSDERFLLAEQIVLASKDPLVERSSLHTEIEELRARGAAVDTKRYNGVEQLAIDYKPYSGLPLRGSTELQLYHLRQTKAPHDPERYEAFEQLVLSLVPAIGRAGVQELASQLKKLRA